MGACPTPAAYICLCSVSITVYLSTTNYIIYNPSFLTTIPNFVIRVFSFIMFGICLKFSVVKVKLYSVILSSTLFLCSTNHNSLSKSLVSDFTCSVG